MNRIVLPTGRDMVSILGEDFFKEEVRCDYLVTEKMKKLWAVIMDLYLEFARVCDKYGLRYFGYGGTILGAIRHEGFIPWDDDLDVCMPREDYEKLISIASQEFKGPYLLQTPYSDPGYFKTIARLMNKYTTYVSRAFLHSGMGHGCILDILPLDNCNPDTIEQEMQQIKVSAKRCSEYLKRNDTDIMTPEQYDCWKQNMPDDPMKEWEIIQQVATKWSDIDTDYYCMKTFVIPGGRYNKPVPKEWFTSAETKKFESIEVKVPKDYENLLVSIYGDYMQFPPVEKRGSWHGSLILDPEKPWTDYL